MCLSTNSLLVHLEICSVALKCVSMHHFQHQESLAAIACVCKCGYVCVYYFIQIIYIHMGFPGGTSGKESSCQCRRHKRHRFDPESGRSPGEGHGNPLQYSCLENCMDRGAWHATVYEVTKGRTRLSDYHTQRNQLFRHHRMPRLENILF